MNKLQNYLILILLVTFNYFAYAAPEQQSDTDDVNASAVNKAVEATKDVETAADFKTKMSEAIEDFAATHKIQAVYSIAQDGKIILNGAQGYYDLANNKRLTISQVMPIASGTKQITAAAILLLQDKGKLNVTDTVAKHLTLQTGMWEGNKIPDWANKVTIHHLLTHSSGIPEYLMALKTKEGRKLNELVRDVLNFAAEKELEYEPGSKATYSNTGYVILGLIIETVSKQPLGQFFSKSFFEPLKMENTRLASFDEGINLQKGLLSSKYPVRYFAVPVEGKSDLNNNGDLRFVPVIQEVFYAPYADGGVLSTTQDMIKWQVALHNGKVLSKKSYAQMTKAHFKVLAPTGKLNSHWGYGTYVAKLPNKKTYYHLEGRALGIRSDNGYIVEDKVAISMLSNLMLFLKPEQRQKIDFRKPENQIDLAYFRDAVIEEI